MKRIIALLLAALLALSLPALAEESLWGRSVSARVVSPPAGAFDSRLDGPSVAGISADGQKLLIIGFGGAPYLWDEQTGEKLYLTPGSELVDELWTLRYEAILAQQSNETREYLQSTYAKAAGDARLAAMMDRSLGLARGTITLGAQDKYMLMFNYNIGIGGLIDCDTGKVYSPDEGEASLPVIDGCAVVKTSAGAKLWNVETGEARDLSFGSDLQSWTVLCARCLPDGSVCGVLEDRTKLDPTGGQDNTLAVIAPDGSRKAYPLGKRRFGRSLDVLLSNGDGSRVIALCRTSIAMDRPYLIDREADTVSLLTRQKTGFKAIPLTEALDEDGMQALTKQQEGSVLMLLTEMKDGTILVLDMSEYDLMLIDPATLESWVLLTASQITELSELRTAIIATLVPLTGNGVDRFILRGQDKYLQLSEGGGDLGSLLGKLLGG